VEHGYHVYSDAAGFLYLVAILDWYSRYVLTWELSNTLDGRFCLQALERALARATRRSSTRIRAHSLPVRPLPVASSRQELA